MKKIRFSGIAFKKSLLAVLAVLALSQIPQHGYAQSQKLSLTVQEASLQDVFRQLEKASNYTFLYKNELLTNKAKVSLKVQDMPLSQILDKILTPRGLTFELDDKVIIIKEFRKKVSNEQPASPRLITGQVTDKDKHTLPGATIFVKGIGSKGTMTDADGNFKIQLPEDKNPVLIVSFIGMQKEEVEVGDLTRLDIQLQPSTVLLDDYVVVGAYGTSQKRSDLVGSAYQVDAKKIQDLPAVRIDNLLDGMVPGLQIDYNSDLASNTRPRYNIRVRGEASLAASAEPLWIIDGTPVYTGNNTNMVAGMSASISPLSFINADDVESITVLKDATATSIYGANGANGVILVTTKSGKTGKTALSLSTQYGISHINKSTQFKVLNAEQYLMLAKESWTNSGRDMKYFPFQDNEINSYSTTDTDWADVYYGLGSTSQTNLAIQGGSNKARYYISGAYFDNKLTVKGNEQQRFSVRTNVDIDINDKLGFSLNMATSYNVNELFNPGDDYYQILPIYSPYNADGSFRMYNKYVADHDEKGNLTWTEPRFLNSVAEREENDDRQRTLANNTNINIKYNIIKGLRFTSQFGVDYQSAYEDQYSARSNWSGMSSNDGAYGYSTRNHSNFLLWTAIQRLNLDRTFGKHKIGGLLGFEANSKEYSTLGATGSLFANDHIKEISYAVDDAGSSSASLSRTMSVFGQGSYSYDNRYYLTINFRKDGSSDFGTDVRWATFGSVGGSWNIHNEAFFSSDKVNILKLKASYGSNGNSRLGVQQSYGLYSYGESYNYMNKPGGALSAIPNPKLSWETSRMLNLGVRIRFLDRFDIDLEAYNKKTVGLLSKLDVSRLTGGTRVTRNMGSIRNTGFEATIGTDIIKKKDFEWTAELNLSHNKNKILSLYQHIDKTAETQIWSEGYDMGTYYLIRWAGVDPRDGAPLWLDANGNITRIYSSDNRVKYKSSAPDLTGGLVNTMSYKGFSLNAILSYQIGGYAFSNFGRRVSSDGLNIMDENQSVNQLDRWQKPGDLALSPKPIWGTSTKSVMNSTRYLYNSTYFQLRNVSLSYDLHSKLLAQAGFSSVRVSLIGDNLGLWTPYDHKNRNSYRQAISGYPMETAYSIGLQCNF